MVEFKGILSISALAVVVVFCTQGISAACPNGFAIIGGRCVKVISSQMSWASAADECGKFAANLAIVDTQEFLNGLTAHLNTNYKGKCISPGIGVESFWVAGQRKVDTNTFNWKIYRSSKFLDEVKAYKSVNEMNNWAPGEPNDVGSDEDCIEMGNYGEKYKFNDLKCSSNNCALCQVDQ